MHLSQSKVKIKTDPNRVPIMVMRYAILAAYTSIGIRCQMPQSHLREKPSHKSHARQISCNRVGRGYVVAVTGSMLAVNMALTRRLPCTPCNHLEIATSHFISPILP